MLSCDVSILRTGNLLLGFLVESEFNIFVIRIEDI